MILPPLTRPWRQKISRRHAPQKTKGVKGFQGYRACLRWEFGFSCAFCLAHETDLAPYGVEGSGLGHVEHFFLQSRDGHQRNVYENCFYSCRFCNVSRGDKPNVDAEDRTLLNPCERAWLGAFTMHLDKMVPRDGGDGDAAYTSEAYELNDPRKKRMRRLRRLTIRQCRRFLKRTRTSESALLDRAFAGGGEEYVDIAWGIDDSRRRAYADLLRFQVVPRDRDTSCRCGHTRNHQLPAVLEEQLIGLDDLGRLPKATRGSFNPN